MIYLPDLEILIIDGAGSIKFLLADLSCRHSQELFQL